MPPSREVRDVVNEITEDGVFCLNKYVAIVPQNSHVTHLQELHPFEWRVVVFGSVGLAFNSGIINGICIQVGNFTVTHMSGATTNAALSLGVQNMPGLFSHGMLVVFFIIGSSITGALVPSDSSFGIRYGPLFLIGSILLLMSCLSDHMAPGTDWYFYFAAMASGLQNAMTTSYTNAIIRTTHITGTATDIGIVLGHMCRGETAEIWKFNILLPLLVGFFAGGLTSVFLFARLKKMSLLVDAAILASIGVAYSIMGGKRLSVPAWRVLLGCFEEVPDVSEEPEMSHEEDYQRSW